ncbi:MAG: hypothetical protein FJ139_03015 [Deltaproteobacteria bacterium]|nr:hypothetical protein [Deltaproteobacteria bacterium]
MKRCVNILCALLFTTAILTGAYAQEKPQEAAKGKRTVKVITTILGTVSAVDAARKTITVRSKYEADYYIHDETILMREYALDKKAVKFDVSEAKFAGCRDDKCAGIKDLKKGAHVRVAYDKVGDDYVAHTVFKIGKRGDR